MPLSMSLAGPSRPPASGGAPDSLVVLLHGYGADGDDLLGLGAQWSQLLPGARFVAPNAPFPCEASPFGFQWFGFENRDEAMLLAGTEAAAALLDAFLDEELARHGLGPDRLALVGFSQGTMMALHVAPRRPDAVAAVVGYSGALIAPERLGAAVRARPPVLLVHGDADPVVPFPAMLAARTALAAAGLATRAETRPGLPHAIDQAGLVMGGRFVAEALAAKARVEVR